MVASSASRSPSISRLRLPRLKRPAPRRRRLLALIHFRDEIGNLPGLFENLEGQVDGVIALDDQSKDESRAFVESQPLLLELLTVKPGAQGYNEDGRNRPPLIRAGWEHGADWLLGIDADERLERDFRRRAEAEIGRAEAEGQTALWVPFLELWDSPDQFRVDGVWGQKRKACLFKATRDHRFDERRLHSIWASWPPPNGEYPLADLRLYHLRMIRPEDREARANLYRRLDPDRTWQEIGYDYLVDETGLELAPIEPGREYVGASRTG